MVSCHEAHWLLLFVGETIFPSQVVTGVEYLLAENFGCRLLLDFSSTKLCFLLLVACSKTVAQYD